jgi:signal peptidase I
MFWNKRQSFLFANSAKVIIVTLVIALGLRVFVVASFRNQSKSMSPTVLPGEIFVGWKIFRPSRGDVVVLPCVKDERRSCIRRIVGMPGDRIEIVQQRLVINTIPATYDRRPPEGDELELSEKWQGRAWPISIDASATVNMDPMVVPPDTVFVLNDHRSGPLDSRQWGPIPTSRLEAKAWRIWMSINWSQNRFNWHRMLQRID